jgi:thioredoxin-like negative regulator of GroEL
MPERALILAVAAALLVLAVLGVRWWSVRRVHAVRAAQSGALWRALGESPDGRPSLVVFSTPSCAVCHTAQHPAVQSVESRFGSAVRVLRVDLSRRPAVGHAFRVLTAPSTVVLTGDGRVESFNHGFAPADRLAAQISAVAAAPASPR